MTRDVAVGVCDKTAEALEALALDDLALTALVRGGRLCVRATA